MLAQPHASRRLVFLEEQVEDALLLRTRGVVAEAEAAADAVRTLGFQDSLAGALQGRGSEDQAVSGDSICRQVYGKVRDRGHVALMRKQQHGSSCRLG